MNRILITSLFILYALSLMSQSRFDKVEIKETKLTDNIYMLEGSGGNIGLVIGEEEVLMIDDQFAPLSVKIMNKIKELSGGKVTRLVNTHWHGDHTGGNENFGNAGAMIIAHQNVYKRMSTEQKRGDRITPASPAAALPVITYDEGMQLYFFDEPVMLMHVHNGHTDGDSFVFLPESNVLHMGDCFFNERFPYIDINSGGSINGIIAAAEAAMMLVDDETQIIPGHGPLASKADLAVYHNTLKTIRDRVQTELAAGKTLEEIDAAAITKGYEEMNWGFINAEKITAAIYTSLNDE